MDSSNAEKAWRDLGTSTRANDKAYFMAGRASREADVGEALNVGHVVGHASRNTEVEALREQLAAAEAAKADAWDEGAAANWDGQDLRHPNPYRTGDTNA